MKHIAITQRLTDTAAYYEIRDALDVRWGKLFTALNMLPVILPIEYDFKKYFDRLQIDGIILSGGNDLSSIAHNELSVKRDKFEKEVVDFALLHNVPLLGVCRGMQLIGEYFGAKLNPVQGHVKTTHQLTVNEKSKHAGLLNKLAPVNSYHNLALPSVPENFLISAQSADGVIEAMEHGTKDIFCMMWHPERETTFNENELQLIKYFFKEQ